MMPDTGKGLSGMALFNPVVGSADNIIWALSWLTRIGLI